MPSHGQTVGGIGWIFGHLIDGTQAESVRVLYADTSLYQVPDGVTNEQAIFLADSLPTVSEVLALTDGLGVDVSIEAVGYPETLLTAAALVRPGGSIANIGVHGAPVALPMESLWIHNVRLTMGLVDTVSIPTLLTMVASGRIPAEKMGTHSFTFGQMDEAYDVFKNAAAHSALKVVISPV